MLHVEWYHVCWPRLTAKRVEPVVSISWASCLILHYGCKILTGRGACHSGGLRNFRSGNVEQWQCCMTVRPANTLILPLHTIRWYGGQPVADTFPPSGWYRVAQVSQHQLSFLYLTAVLYLCMCVSVCDSWTQLTVMKWWGLRRNWLDWRKSDGKFYST